MQTVATSEPVQAKQGNDDDAEYDAFLARVQMRFTTNVEGGKVPLFTTDATELWAAYLDSFGPAPAEGEAAGTARQYHTCNACRRFIERFGGLVTIDTEGRVASAIWDETDAPEHYKPAVAAMARLVRRAKVTGVFVSSEIVWGTPETGTWRHFAVVPPVSTIWNSRTQKAHERRAEKGQDFETVRRALGEFSLPNVELALTLLKTDALYRSEKVLGQAEWLQKLHVAQAAARGPARDNVLWRAIVTAPAGFCHPRSSMIGTLLEDIAAGMDFAEVSRRFATKMHPLSYQRPQAAPTAGAIAAAEKVMEQLGAAGALARRFARLDEVQALWKPAAEKGVAPAGGVFGHLKPKGATSAPSMKVPAQTMTWAKFEREVLPTAEQIEIQAPLLGSYTSLVTAVNADAPPILQWDSPEKRNPVSWYFWAGGSSASQFGLSAGEFHKVNAVTLKPSMWNGGHEHQGAGVLFVIDGAADSRTPGACLFPEILRSELHGVRSVIEAYSQGAKMEGASEQSAAGLMLQKGQPWNATVRVTLGGKSLEYRLDRWD